MNRHFIYSHWAIFEIQYNYFGFGYSSWMEEYRGRLIFLDIMIWWWIGERYITVENMCSTSKITIKLLCNFKVISNICAINRESFCCCYFRFFPNQLLYERPSTFYVILARVKVFSIILSFFLSYQWVRTIPIPSILFIINYH